MVKNIKGEKRRGNSREREGERERRERGKRVGARESYREKTRDHN